MLVAAISDSEKNEIRDATLKLGNNFEFFQTTQTPNVEFLYKRMLL